VRTVTFEGILSLASSAAARLKTDKEIFAPVSPTGGRRTVQTRNWSPSHHSNRATRSKQADGSQDARLVNSLSFGVLYRSRLFSLARDPAILAHPPREIEVIANALREVRI
jgi:hypothetical protein